jgi:hypothetical protein
LRIDSDRHLWRRLLLPCNLLLRNLLLLLLRNLLLRNLLLLLLRNLLLRNLLLLQSE